MRAVAIAAMGLSGALVETINKAEDSVRVTHKPELMVEKPSAGRHADLAAHARGDVPRSAVRAAEAVHAAGGSPRLQLEAARAASGANLTYQPHQGMRERLRRLRKAERLAAKHGAQAPTEGSDENG